MAFGYFFLTYDRKVGNRLTYDIRFNLCYISLKKSHSFQPKKIFYDCKYEKYFITALASTMR